MGDRTGKRRVELSPAAETLLIPLYGRAQLTRGGSPLIDDPKAIEMVEAIDWDFARFDGAPSLVGSVLRTRMLDLWVASWLDDHPDGTVIEVGAGLNTRFERLDNGRVRWIDLDLPDAMALRREFFPPSERRQMIAASVTDDTWIGDAGGDGPWFVVAEAVLCFLEEPEVRRTLEMIGTRLPDALIAFDTWGSWLRDNADQHDALKVVDAEVTWFCDTPRVIEAWAPGFRLIESRTLAELPESLASLIPDAVQATMASAEARPQVEAYRLNLFQPLTRSSPRPPSIGSPRTTCARSTATSPASCVRVASSPMPTWAM